MSLKFSSLAAPAVVALALAGFGAPSLALTPEDEGPPAQPTCEKGYIYDTKIKNCVSESTVVRCDAGFSFDEARKTCVRNTALNDADLYHQGRLLALAGHYGSAVDTLGAVRDKNSSVLTMLGYATRKLGDIDAGIGIYHQALALDPRNASTHEYLGEGYLAAGRVDLAEVELDAVKSICGTTCVQYQALSKALYSGAWN